MNYQGFADAAFVQKSLARAKRSVVGNSMQIRSLKSDSSIV